MGKLHLIIQRDTEIEFTCRKCGYVTTVSDDNKNTIRWARANEVCFRCKDYKKLPFVPVEAVKPVETNKTVTKSIKENKFDFFDEPINPMKSFFM